MHAILNKARVWDIIRVYPNTVIILMKTLLMKSILCPDIVVTGINPAILSDPLPSAHFPKCHIKITQNIVNSIAKDKQYVCVFVFIMTCIHNNALVTKMFRPL